jgi:hypothetical protein
MTRISHRLRLLALIIGAGLSANTVLLAGPVLDPANDFRKFDPAVAGSFSGVANPALDVLSANVILDLTKGTLTFTSTMAGPISGLIDPTTGANQGSFSWGINHGFGTLNFGQPAVGLPNVIFDSVLSLSPNGTGSFRGNQAPAGSVIPSGNTLTAVLPITFLAPPGQALDVTQWSYNLWPRSTISGVPGLPAPTGDAQIADFAPNTTDFLAEAVPEPASLIVMGSGLGVVMAWSLRGRRRRPQKGFLS